MVGVAIVGVASQPSSLTAGDIPVGMCISYLSSAVVKCFALSQQVYSGSGKLVNLSTLLGPLAPLQPGVGLLRPSDVIIIVKNPFYIVDLYWLFNTVPANQNGFFKTALVMLLG